MEDAAEETMGGGSQGRNMLQILKSKKKTNHSQLNHIFKQHTIKQTPSIMPYEKIKQISYP